MNLYENFRVERVKIQAGIIVPEWHERNREKDKEDKERDIQSLPISALYFDL
jgi:hypothetical protein